MNKLFLCSIIIIISFSSLWSQINLFQNPPKDKAEIFAPEFVSSSDKEHGKLTISPDMKHIYWDYKKLPLKDGEVQKIAIVSKSENSWRKRENAIFNDTSDLFSPCFIGNDTLLLGKRTNIGSDSTLSVSDFWIIIKKMENGQNLGH